MKTILMALGLLGMTTVPSFALFCSSEGPKAGDITVLRNGEFVSRPDVEGQADLDKQRLRDAGVDARSVERWNGCLRAFVAKPEGGQSMEFYDPATLERLQ